MEERCKFSADFNGLSAFLPCLHVEMILIQLCQGMYSFYKIHAVIKEKK